MKTVSGTTEELFALLRRLPRDMGFAEADVENLSKVSDIVGMQLENILYENLVAVREGKYYDYPDGFQPKGLQEQASIIRQLFPGIGVWVDQRTIQQDSLPPLPANAEGWFAIPRWELIATTYGEAVRTVTHILKARGWQVSDWTNICQSDHTAEKYANLCRLHGDADILVVAAQFGRRFQNRSMHGTCEKMCAQDNEFGLGAFAVGCMLLVHPKRFGRSGFDLAIDCPGDRVVVSHEHEKANCFLQFGPSDVAVIYENAAASCKAGAATAFMPFG
jgi:hypothetical protein